MNEFSPESSICPFFCMTLNPAYSSPPSPPPPPSPNSKFKFKPCLLEIWGGLRRLGSRLWCYLFFLTFTRYNTFLILYFFLSFFLSLFVKKQMQNLVFSIRVTSIYFFNVMQCLYPGGKNSNKNLELYWIRKLFISKHG